MAIFARFAYAGGANVTGVLLARFAIAGLVLALVMLATRRAWPRGRALAVAIGMGAIGYAGQSALFFSALNHASAGLVALLLYAYPTLVVLFSAALHRERPTPARLVLLAASFAGLGLTLGGGQGTATGIALGLAAAVVYSAYILVGARELKETDALASTTVICLAAAAAFAVSALFSRPSWPGVWWSWAATAAIALVSTVVSILAFLAGLKRVGPATASIVSTLEPVVTVALAWLILGERLASTQLLGGVLVLACAVALALPRRGVPGPATAGSSGS